MLRFNLSMLVCVVMVAGLVGCGAGGGTDVGAVAVSGTVTYNGSPVEGATVVFAPTGTDGKSAAGTTDAQGHFTLTTVEAGDGAVPGAYGVTVTKSEGGAAPGGTQTEEEAYASGFPEGDGATATPAGPEIKDILPAKYKVAETSGLTATVEASGGGDFTFELKDE
jgi:hypothetical protein